MKDLLNVETVRARLDAVDSAGRDYEVAHCREDDLLWEFVRQMAKWADFDENADRVTYLEIARTLAEWDAKNSDRTRYYA